VLGASAAASLEAWCHIPSHRYGMMTISTPSLGAKTGIVIMDASWPKFRWLVVALIGVVCLAGQVPMTGVAQTEADAAAEFAYGLSGLERDGNFDQLYRLMHPDAKAIVPKSAVVGWYQEDFAPQQPQAITEITAVRQVSWIWPVTGKTYPTTYEVDYVQPFGTGPTYEYVNETVRLVPTGNSFGWFFGRSREFVDEQIARFPEQAHTASATNQDQSASRASSAQTGTTGCTLVELYPGYPGYRGNVTGVMAQWNGLGDYECLEVLERQAPTFDRAREDRANQQAADTLGINGSKELWTWENWLQIEAERGMMPSCYTCLMLDSAVAPRRTDVQQDPSDPRLLTGFLGTTIAIPQIANSIGVGSVSAYENRLILNFFVNDDYVLRSLAYVSGGSRQNAEELYKSMQELVRFAISPYNGMFDLPSAKDLIRYAIWQVGGYTHVPDNAAAADQAAMMVYGLGMLSTVLSPEAASGYLRELYGAIESWQAAGATIPLDSFLQQQPTWQEFR
jgi:hypothetical protein